MKRTIVTACLLTIALFQAAFARTSASEDLFREVVYSPSDADIFIYLNCDSVMKFMKRNGVEPENLAAFTGQAGNHAADYPLGKMMLSSMDRMIIVTGTGFMQRDGAVLVFFTLKSGLPEFRETIEKFGKTMFQGRAIYSMDNSSANYITVMNDVIVMGYGPLLKGYLSARIAGVPVRPDGLKMFIEKERPRDLFIYLSLTGNLKKSMASLLDKSRMPGQAMQGNVFLETLSSCRHVTAEVSLEGNMSVTAVITGNSEADSRRLLMLNHFLIVGTSIVFPFADQLSLPLKEKDLDIKKLEPGRVQEIFGRIRTFQVDKGAGMSFEFSREETAFLVNAIRSKAAAKKRKQDEKLREIHAASLIDAVKKRNEKSVDDLLNRIGNADVKGPDGENPLSLAAETGSHEIVRLLIERGASVERASDGNRMTPLHGAVMSEKLKIVTFLMEKGAPLESRDIYGRTPLFIAVEKGNLEIVRILMAAGADVRTAALDGRNPVHLAAEKGETDIVKELINGNADLSARDFYGETPVDKARSGGHEDVLKLLKRKESERTH